MRYRIHQVKLNMNQGHDALESAVRKKLKRRNLNIYDLKIVKESIDARKKPDIKLVYTLDFSCDETLPLDEAKPNDYDRLMAGTMQKYRDASKALGEGHAEKRPIIAGFGPCGMFAALILAEAGLRPIVLERGQAVDERLQSVKRFWENGILDPESNVQFGEGGAGTFSDGKLTTGIKDMRISKVLKEFVAAGADSSILYKQKPHLGTDQLRDIVKNIRKKIELLGGEIRFNTKLEGIVTENCNGTVRLKAIELRHRTDGMASDSSSTGAAGIQTIETDALILAIGHSARDTFEKLYIEGVLMEQKPFSIGVRIEHLQEMINHVQYGAPWPAEKLGPADYKLNHRCKNGRGVYTFCMCPGGLVINAASEENTAVTNGMSNSARDGRLANSGLLVDVHTEDFPSAHPLAGVEFQRKYERLAYQQGQGNLPKTSYKNFREDRDDKVRKSLPDFAADAIIEAMPYLGRKLKGFDSEDAVMTAVETRSSSPVRIRRDETMQSEIKGLYPAGEGSGYAGGIMSAAVDGIKAAEGIMAVIFP